MLRVTRHQQRRNKRQRERLARGTDCVVTIYCTLEQN